MSKDGDPVEPETSKRTASSEIARLNKIEEDRKAAEAKSYAEIEEKRRKALEKRARKEQEQNAAREKEAREREELESKKLTRVDKFQTMTLAAAKEMHAVASGKGVSKGETDGLSPAALEAKSSIKKGIVKGMATQLESTIAAQFAARQEAMQAADTAKSFVQPQTPPAKLPVVPCRAQMFTPNEKDLLQKLLDQISDHPEAQTLSEVKKGDVAKSNTKILSVNANLVAKSMGELEEVPLKASPKGERKTYEIEVDREGPVYMPRKKDDGKNFRQNGEPVYDMLYYVKDGDKFVVDHNKSFIAADGIPEGSLSSVTKETRENCWKHHGEKFEKSKSITPADDLGPNHAKAEATRVVADLAVPPAPPAPPPEGSSVTKEANAGKSLAEELKAAVQKKNQGRSGP